MNSNRYEVPRPIKSSTSTATETGGGCDYQVCHSSGEGGKRGGGGGGQGFLNSTPCLLTGNVLTDK